MPDPRPDRLSYARGAMEKLRRAHEHLSQEQLLDLVCHLTKTYVIEQTIPFDVPLPERADPRDRPDVGPARDVGASESPAVEVADPEASPVRRFARLVEGLKRRAQLPQLEGFSVQDGKVVLVVDNQKVTFGERVTIEFVPVRQASAPTTTAAEPAAAPRAVGAPARATAAPAPRAEAAAPFAAAPAAPGRPARPAATPATRPGAPSRAARPEAKPTPEPAQPTSDDGSDVDHNAIERFKRLELD